MVDLNFWKFFFKTLKDVSGAINTCDIFKCSLTNCSLSKKKKKKKCTVSKNKQPEFINKK